MAVCLSCLPSLELSMKGHSEKSCLLELVDMGLTYCQVAIGLICLIFDKLFVVGIWYLLLQYRTKNSYNHIPNWLSVNLTLFCNCAMWGHNRSKLCVA